MKVWHFVGDTLRDGRSVPADGEKLTHDGELVMCRSGLHASESIIDALQYAPGSTICRVEVSGEILTSTNKLVASERTILWRVEGHTLLRKFARQCALDVIHLWDAPDVVRQYLETGDESLRDAARAAASAEWAARAAKDAAMAVARDAEWAARAAGAAAWASERAAGAAAWASERAAECAAGDAAMDAAAAAMAAEWAARAAARDTQNKRLEAMVRDAR